MTTYNWIEELKISIEYSILIVILILENDVTKIKKLKNFASLLELQKLFNNNFLLSHKEE